MIIFWKFEDFRNQNWMSEKMTQEKEKILWGGRFDKSPDELLWVCICFFEIMNVTDYRNTMPR